MKIEYAQARDEAFWRSVDTHVDAAGFRNRVYAKTGYVMRENGVSVGLLWYCVLWDNLPFLNLVFVLEEHRRKGYAAQAMAQWEAEMKGHGYRMLLLSTQVDEGTQAFYRKLGYVDCGGLVFEGTPFHQPMEMFMRKVLVSD